VPDSPYRDYQYCNVKNKVDHAAYDEVGGDVNTGPLY
jgi:hypothetical protein